MFVNNNTVATDDPTTVPRYTVSAVVYKNIEHASMNYPVLSAVCGVFLLYVLGLLWIKRIRSKEQVHIGATIIPHRSFYRHPHHYFLLFYTGSGRHAGTTANVYCVIHGKQKKTKPIVLRDPERLLFQSGTTTSFLLTLNKPLDQLTKLHLWHDISGPKPSWFLEKVVVCHLNTGLLWHFEAHRWLDVSENDGSVECTLHALPRSNYLRRKTLFDQMFSKSFKNNHIWLSPFFLKTRTMFSRVERFTSCIAVIMVTVLVVTVVVDSKKDGDVFPSQKINLGPMAFQLSDIIWGVICSVIPFFLRLLLEFLFTYSESKFGQLPPDERDVKTHIDWCLNKANEITFLDGQSNTLEGEKEKNTEELENGEEETETQIKENESELSNKMRKDSLRSGSEWEYLAESWSEVSLRNIGLDLTNQECVSDNLNEKERLGSELHGVAKPNSNLDLTNQDCVSENQNENERLGSELHGFTKPDSNLDLTNQDCVSENQNENERLGSELHGVAKPDSILDLTNQDCVSENQNENERLGSELHGVTKPDSNLDVNSDTTTNKGTELENQVKVKEDIISPSIPIENGSSAIEEAENELSTTLDTENENRDDIQLMKEEGPQVIPNGTCKTTPESSQEPITSNGQCFRGVLRDSESLFEDGRMSTSSKKIEIHRKESPTEQLNFAYTNSLTNTDKIPKLWKMIPFPGFLIDPNSIKIRNEKNTLNLSVKFFYFAVFVCLAFSIVSTIVTIKSGLSWSSQITISWLMTIAFALLFQMLIAESFYMFFQAIYFGVYLQRPVEENDVINEQKNKVWAKEEDDVRYYVDDLDDVGSLVPRPPSAEEIKKAREKAGQDRQLEEVLMMVAFDIIFLVQLVIISLGNRDAWSYPMRTVVETNYNVANFSNIQSAETFWGWTKTHLATGLYYEGKFKQAGSRQTRDGYGTLLGVPILRQQRVKPNGTCQLNEYSISYFSGCNVQVPKAGQYEEQDYNPGWTYKPASDVIPQSPWIHKKGSQSNTDYSMFARIASYESGGYIASLGYNKSTALKMLDDLEKLKWIDRFTRVVFIEFASYNGNINILSEIVLAVEFTAFGGAFPRFDHFSFRLYRYFTPFQLIYLVCEVIFIVFIVQLMYKVSCEIYEYRFTYFFSFWNLTDVVLVISSLVTIGLYGARAIQLQNGVKAIQENPKLFYGFYPIAVYDDLVAFMSCIVVIVPVLQFLKFLKFNKNFMIFDLTLKLLIPDLKGFILIFMISLFAFAFWAFHMLGTALESYSTFIGAFNSVLSMLLGKFSFRVFAPGESQEFGPLFTYVFTVVNVFFIMTIILCIITMAFTKARQDNSITDKYEIVKFIVGRAKDVLGLNPPYIPPKPVIKPTPVDYNQLQLELNTQYILGSQMSRILRFANVVYSEETIDDVEILERILGLENGAEYLKTIIRKRKEEQQAPMLGRHSITVPHGDQETEEPKETANHDQDRRLSTFSIENECSQDFVA